MTLDVALRYVTWAVYLAVFLLVLRRALRTPTPAHRDEALFFGIAAALIVVSTAEAVLGVPPAGWLNALAGVLAIALPYTLLRLVAEFAPSPIWLTRAAEAGLAIGFVLLIALPAPLPTVATVALVAYFVLLTGYDTTTFFRESARTGGVTRRRMEAAALGCVALAVVVVLASLATFDPPRAELWTVLSRLSGLASALAYYAGFTPPAWLRRSWQAPSLQAFLTEIGRLPYLAELRDVLAALEARSATVLGAHTAAIGLWQETEGALRFWQGLGDRPALRSYPEDTARRGFAVHDRVVDVPPDRLFSGRAFLQQRPVFSADVQRDDPDNEALYRAGGVRAVLAAPITAGERRLGVLTVWSPRAPVFAESDLELAQLLARQAAVVLEARTLLEQVAEARAREEADRLKDEFLASISHDLRNPLTAVSAIAQVLRRRLQREGAVEPARLDASLTSIETAATQMKQLTDQLLDYARFRLDRRLDLNREPTDLVDLARRVVLSQGEASDQHHVELEATEASLIGTWDADRLERVVQNLVSNAVKYSPDGGTIRVRVWREQGSDRAWAALAVEDEGVGIPAADLPRIFERFQRASNTTGFFPGTGIGLATARQIVEQHGGRIEAASEEGRGSVFTVRLPLEPPEESEPPVEPPREPAAERAEPVAAPRLLPGLALHGGTT